MAGAVIVPCDQVRDRIRLDNFYFNSFVNMLAWAVKRGDYVLERPEVREELLKQRDLINEALKLLGDDC